ncbi:MAG: translation initiation factor IF-2 N-terminal domain-containing protein, partial [Verrucomicrobiota bacterium]
MPVRIYEIAKKLGIENKEVLAKAKALGITTAKVPSSSLDKITAEFLEEQLGGIRTAVATTPAPAPEPTPLSPLKITSKPVEVPELT